MIIIGMYNKWTARVKSDLFTQYRNREIEFKNLFYQMTNYQVKYIEKHTL